MDDNRLHKYYSSGNGLNSLVYSYLVTDRYFRNLLNFGPYCGAITAITIFLTTVVFAYTLMSWTIFLSNTKKVNELRVDAQKNLPKKESVMQVKPVYNCINKHVRKEQLEVELMNSRLNSITELLNPGDRRSRSPKGYFRDINTPMKVKY